MRHPTLILLLTGSVFLITACQDRRNATVARAIDAVLSIDQQNMAELMLVSGDTEEAVNFFSTQSEANPGDITLQRGLARSLTRAGRPAEALPVWRRISSHPEATHDDRVMLADTYIRANDWSRAEATLNTIPPTHETFDRYRLEAMIADKNRQWSRADHFYETAAGLTTRPSSVFNNWGFSHLTRGNPGQAEALFAQALQHDPSSFTIKNNLALARAGQRNYRLPLVQMSQQERAQLLFTMAIVAIRQGDTTIGRTLLAEAIDTHPQHFDDAVRALRALDSGGYG